MLGREMANDRHKQKWSRAMRRCVNVLAVLGLGAVVLAMPAAAGARVFVGVGIGVPVYAPPPVYYYPPPAPVYYPPVVYAPPPVVAVAPAVTPAAPPPPPSGYCRQYKGDATIDGNKQPFYGTACLQSDGKWHVVN